MDHIDSVVVPFLAAIPVSFLFCLWLVFKYYEKFQKIFSDFLSLFTHISKYARKTQIQCSIEGNLNGFARRINSELDGLILPMVKVEIVNPKDTDSFINDGVPIIRMDFVRNANQNMACATLAYVRTALIDKAKPYLSDDIKEAIDHNIARAILADFKKGESLSYFDEEFLSPKIQASPSFNVCHERIEDIRRAGLLTRVLLREYKDLGQRISPRIANDSDKKETQGFLDYLHNIIVHKKDDSRELKFEGVLIKTGIILVAKSETYRKHGINPYLRRATLLAGRGIRNFYLLAQGKSHRAILDEVVMALKHDGNYRMLEYKVFKTGGMDSYCVLIEVDCEGLAANVKKVLETAKEKNRFLDATVICVWRDSIEVDIDGVQAVIPKNELSDRLIEDAEKYFSAYDELKVRVIGKDEANTIIVSNKGGVSDPLLRIEAKYTAGDKYKAVIDEVKDGGILVTLEDGMKGFIPSSRATFSRFEKLSAIYSEKQTISVLPIRYDTGHDNLRLSIVDLHDPWLSIDIKIKVGDIVGFKVWVIEPRKILGEIVPGVEGIIFPSDWDWKLRDVASLGLSVGGIVQAKIKEIDKDRHSLVLSLKDVVNNPLKKFYEQNKLSKNDCTVSAVIEGFGLEVDFLGGVSGKIHISELDRGFVKDLKAQFPVGMRLEVGLLSFEERTNIIWASRKILLPNPFDEATKLYSVGDEIAGKFHRLEPWGGNITVQNNLLNVDFFLPTGEVTRLCYIKDAKGIYEFNREYKFLIKEFVPERQRVIITRKGYFDKSMPHFSLNAGTVFSAKVIGRNADGIYVVESNDDFQAVLVELDGKKKRIKIGDSIEVIYAGRGSGGEVEVLSA